MQTEKEKAKKRWERANVSYENYQDFINKKEKGKEFEITLIDLLYISNFIGGNATICENESEVNNKLISYSEKLKKTEGQNLSDLSDTEINILIENVKEICNLTNKKATSNINGFSVTNLSALLSAYFPNLIPILNKRVLKSLGIIPEKDMIKNYALLIRKIAELAKKEPNKQLRDIDFELYTKID